jgi:membrane fusion protein, copper/silver efflux system
MNKQTLIVAILVALVAGGGGYWFASNTASTGGAAVVADADRKPVFYRNPMNPAITSPVPAQDEMGMDYIPVYADNDQPKERKALFYRNPMNPAITSPVPAQDEMGMDYIPVYADADNSGGAAGTVKIDPVTIQNIGVRSVVAEQRNLSRNIRAVGRVAYDEEHLSRLHPKTEGWVKELRVDKTGSQVKKGDILLSVYAPQLVASQEEYLLALKNEQILAESPFPGIRQGAINLASTARDRLELLDMAEHQILELERSQKIKREVHIHSPFNGIAMKVGVREGQYITPSTELFMLADLSKVWVYADVYEYELPWISVNDTVEMKLAGVPGRIFSGRLAYIYPYAEAKTRTVKVRLVFDNKELLLKPDMFAEVTIAASKQIDAIVVPAEAIVRSGTREQVFIVKDGGKFEPRVVTLGVTTDGMTQLLSGVEAGEEVVTSAQFLIDSESKLREATAKMMEVLNAASAADSNADMSDMAMDDMNMGDMDMGDVSMDSHK